MPFSARIGFYQDQAVAPAPAGYPDWPTQATEAQFDTEVALYSGVAGTPSNNNFGQTLSGTTNYRGGCRAPNGNIYCFPRSDTPIWEIDPDANTSTLINTGLIASNEYTGGCLGGNGNIYLAPFSGTNVLEFDPVNRTYREIATGLTGTNNYNGAVMDTTGNVFCIPQNQTTCVKVDCSVEPVSISTVNFGATFGSARYISGTVHPNGNIYLAPLQSDSFLELDPATETSTTYSTGKGTGQLLCQGALTGADGKIYGVSYNSSTILRLDPDTGTVDEPFTHGQGTNAFIGGVAAPNGNIYLAPFDADNIYEIDPLAGTASTITLYSADDEFVGAVSDEANVYFIPNNALGVEVLPTNATGGTNANAYTLSSYVNSGL